MCGWVFLIYLLVLHVKTTFLRLCMYCVWMSLPGVGKLMMSGASSNEQGGRLWKGEGSRPPGMTSHSLLGSPSLGWLGTCWTGVTEYKMRLRHVATTNGKFSLFSWFNTHLCLTSLLSSIRTASCVSLLSNWLTCLMGLVKASAYSENTHTQISLKSQWSAV